MNPGSGVTERIFYIADDTLLVLDITNKLNADMKLESSKTLLYKKEIKMENIIRLEDLISNLDSIGMQINKCGAHPNTQPSFFLYAKCYARALNGYVQGVYREGIYRIVDIFNELYPPGKALDYDKIKLITSEADCKY
jgi:hypothetical protein